MKLSDADIDKFLADLSSYDIETREKAERFYNENKAEVLPQFFARLAQRVDEMEAGNKWTTKFLRFLLYLCAIAIFLFGTGKYKESPFFSIILVLLITYGINGCIMELVRTANVAPPQAYLLNLLNELDDPRFVSYMIDLMIQGNLQTIKIIEPILYRHLLLLRPSHAELLSMRHYLYLRKRLVYYGCLEARTFNEEKTLAILRALEHTLDANAISPMWRVHYEGGTRRVRDTAKECIDHIYKYGSGRTPREYLLRASESTSGQEELLRAANAQTDTQPETLLRVPKE